ncbi:hypothetical protein [Microvirga splendida]|uniref:Hemerythrin-like domain-containing protein n=1 Tax=Microvirga splendida TaxID=2795727 RepID=A0ABS0XZC3_9HYPH|nr:hypothetical protein [Microvirga splendida]MBJ6125392.1 hypothetical protein [Microvirga splendida]
MRQLRADLRSLGHDLHPTGSDTAPDLTAALERFSDEHIKNERYFIHCYAFLLPVRPIRSMVADSVGSPFAKPSDITGSKCEKDGGSNIIDGKG